MAPAACVRRLPSLSSNSLTRSVCGQSWQTRITPLASLLIVYITPSIHAAFSAQCDRNRFPVTFVLERGGAVRMGVVRRRPSVAETEACCNDDEGGYMLIDQLVDH